MVTYIIYEEEVARPASIAKQVHASWRIAGARELYALYVLLYSEPNDSYTRKRESQGWLSWKVVHTLADALTHV